MTISSIDGIEGANLVRMYPEPETSSTFDAVRAAVRGVADSAVSLLERTGGTILDSVPMGGDLQSLIQLQLDAQREMMTVSMISNIEKSKHETQMAAVRNMRVG